ncbi:MAG TPA: multicopper oxidase domain-containing protein [Candidatus Methylomirabilis sp.]|nr:multicopper oxidase domain-containing protein [Candidatus Methylomirabilis sp.]
MALPKSGNRIKRRSLAGLEGMWTKMFDPPKDDSSTPEALTPTNPVPRFMRDTLGADMPIAETVRVDLMHGDDLTMWDGKRVAFYLISNPDLPQDPVDWRKGFWPGPTIRVPRGKIFHGQTHAHGPPPHTIHWHGLEPTPMNDGVGHCSLELGDYTYQFQPNFIGTYFYHCHRNTVQHFEFGLYGMFLVEPPDAYDQQDPNLPFYAGGYPRRTAANLAKFSQFPGFVGGDATWGVAGLLDIGVGHPHAFTVPYDGEALWVFDDRDSRWSDLASDPRAFYPGGANTQNGPLGGDENGVPPIPAIREVLRPGVDDDFAHGFFHDFNADYWFVTGVPVVPDDRDRANRIGTIDASLVPEGVLDANGHIAPALNSGVAGMQVPIDAQVNQTILIRILNGAYNVVEVTFPVDVVIIAFDGRALGVPPFAKYNEPFELKKGDPIRFSTARRFDVLVRATEAIDSFATAKFFDTRGQNVDGVNQDPLMTARIPFVIGGAVE